MSQLLSSLSPKALQNRTSPLVGQLAPVHIGPGDDTVPVLRFEDGPQAGLVLPIAIGETRIGNGLDADLVIDGVGVAFIHLSLHHHAGSVSIRANGAAIRLDGQTLASGTEAVLAGCCRIEAGSRHLLVQVPPAAIRPVVSLPAEPVARRRPVWPFAAGAVLLAASGGGFVGTLLRPSPATAPPVVGPAVPVVPVARLASAAEAALRQRLDAAGLSGLAVARGEDNALSVSGILLPAQQPSWDKVHEWFDARFGGSQMLVDRTGPFGAGPALQVASVWLGEAPYVVDGDGTKLFVGSAAGDGWSVAAIAPHVIRLRKDARTLEIGF